MSGQIQNEDLSRIYSTLRSKSLDQIKKLNLPIGDFQSVELVHRSTQNISEGEWVSYVSRNELPPMKLSQAELEVVKGGFIGLIIRVGSCLLSILEW